MAIDTTATANSRTTTRRQVLAAVGVGIGASLAGCISESDQSTPRPPEATVTVRLRNRDDQPREFEVIVTQSDSLSDSFSGVLPAGSQAVEMIATVRATDEQHEFSITTAGGQRGGTWDPTECGDFIVDAYVEGGDPGFETACRGE